MSSFIDLYSVKPFKTQWRVYVKILKVWKPYLNGVETLEMVVVDEKNQTMHVTLKKEFIKKNENLLEEGASRIITNFQVAHNGGKFRISPHVYKILFASTTSVKPAEAMDPRILGFKFVKFSDIHEGKMNPDFLIDAIGQIVSIGDVEILNVGKRQTKRLSMEIRDTEDVRLNCVIWGQFAENLESVAQHANDAMIVAVLRFEKLKLYQGVWSVSNCYNCSMVITDPVFPESLAFKERLSKYGLTLTYTHPNQLTIVNSVSVRDDFFLHSPRRTISEIIAASEVVKCVTMATIMSIDTKFGWYYMSCGACAKKCKKCNEDVENVYPSFMLTFRVMDNTGETKFLLFDQEAKEVVNQTAAQLTQSVNEIQDPNVLPLALSNICGKTFLFKIAIASSNIVFNSHTYKVISIITQSDVVKEFSKISTPQSTPSIKIEEKAHNTLDGKVPLMIMDDDDAEITPTSKRKSNEKMEVIKDIDEYSAAKKKCKDEKTVETNPSTVPLKTVKTEKP
ncbi:replication protein A 70 kDa DNA-binding subunit C-like [Eutrema salsugineum]|uniref:replication protein A 70 kDa DNA-binding subunit C-like n=1 Tax=Eutrema salsugineum TaxID=72664 RepID=UPI000CED4D18|nr:replication protein A 70 kDa DNA-binding subunit C-like [Eutrema salsugineum]